MNNSEGTFVGQCIKKVCGTGKITITTAVLTDRLGDIIYRLQPQHENLIRHKQITSHAYVHFYARDRLFVMSLCKSSDTADTASR